MNTNLPACRLTLYEKQYGYIRNSIFYRPTFGIYRNNEPISIKDFFSVGYSHAVPIHIVSHLKVVSSNCFTIESLARTPIPKQYTSANFDLNTLKKQNKVI